jgi:Flp pilus assembly protein TadD
MFWKRRFLHGLLLIAVAASGLHFAQAGEIKDWKINIPRGSKLTPVQRLNREGVEAIKKHNFSKAEKLFYKAYLYDPGDAFTLNNLGYISELQGQIERAQQYYSLAAQQSSEAVVDLASASQVRGRPMGEALALTSEPLQVNHANVEAVRLLSQGRAS